jgi:hypothetical protein
VEVADSETVVFRYVDVRRHLDPAHHDPGQVTPDESGAAQVSRR